MNIRDCGTLDGLEIHQLVEGGEVIERLGDRILGRVALTDITDPVTAEVLVGASEEIDEDKVRRIEEAGIEHVTIRSVLTCNALRGVCALCYGRDLGQGKLVNLGEAIGVIAAQSIGEPGTQLTMRTFHIGGTATQRVEQSHVEARNEGVIKYLNLSTIRDKHNAIIVMNRNGEIAVVDSTGRERERYPVVYGAKLQLQDGAPMKAGQLDPRVGPVPDPDPRGRRRPAEVRRHPLRPDDGGAGRRVHRPVAQGHRRVEGPRPAAAHLDQGSRGQHHPALHDAGRREHLGDRGRDGRAGRHARAHPARDDQDQGHHRRSAARRRALRGPQAEGVRDRLGDRRHGVASVPTCAASGA